MARFIVILLLFVTIVIVAFNFLLGLLRRLFGLGPMTRSTKVQKKSSEVLYEHDGTVVLRGTVTDPKDPE